MTATDFAFKLYKYVYTCIVSALQDGAFLRVFRYIFSKKDCLKFR